MKFKLLFFLLLLGLFGCNSQTELPLLDSLKPADKFARTFIDKIIAGQAESSFNNIEPSLLNDEAKEFILKTSQNLKGALIKKYSLIEQKATYGFVSSTGKSTTYRLSYEYEFTNANNILFITTVLEKDNRLTISSFDGQVLETSLKEQAKFSFFGKPIISYIFLLFAILVLCFIIYTLINMLRCQIFKKRKILWSFIILFVSLPTIIVNWNSGALDFKMLNFQLLGVGFGQASLYTPFLLSFGIPIGALLFWLKRDNLLREFEQASEEYNQ